jgi:hypothetical protein
MRHVFQHGRIAALSEGATQMLRLQPLAKASRGMTVVVKQDKFSEVLT